VRAPAQKTPQANVVALGSSRVIGLPERRILPGGEREARADGGLDQPFHFHRLLFFTARIYYEGCGLPGEFRARIRLLPGFDLTRPVIYGILNLKSLRSVGRLRVYFGKPDLGKLAFVLQ